MTLRNQAISSFWYMSSNMNLLFNQSFSQNLPTFNNITKIICSMSLSEV